MISFIFFHSLSKNLSKFKILFLLRFKRLKKFSSSLLALRPEGLHISLASSKTFQGPPHGIQVERDKLNKYGCPSIRCTIKLKLGLSTKNYVGTLLSILKEKLKLLRTNKH